MFDPRSSRNQDNVVYYGVGYRDAIAQLFMDIRLVGLEQAVRQCAQTYHDFDPNNPHVEHYLGLIAEAD